MKSKFLQFVGDLLNESIDNLTPEDFYRLAELASMAKSMGEKLPKEDRLKLLAAVNEEMRGTFSHVKSKDDIRPPQQRRVNEETQDMQDEQEKVIEIRSIAERLANAVRYNPNQRKIEDEYRLNSGVTPPSPGKNFSDTAE